MDDLIPIPNNFIEEVSIFNPLQADYLNSERKLSEEGNRSFLAPNEKSQDRSQISKYSSS